MPKLTPDQMVSIKAVAPFEIAEAMALWLERVRAEAKDTPMVLRTDLTPEDMDDVLFGDESSCNGLGTPWPLDAERPKEFGERTAFAIFTLLKEI